MRRKTHSVALALAASAAVGAPLAASSSCSSSSSGPTADAGTWDVTVLEAGTCGDGVLNLGEQCDLGMAKNTPGSGCEPNCNFTCIPDTLNGSAVCDDHNPCNGA